MHEGRRVTGNVKMIIPVRCFTCGKPLGAEYEEFKKRVEAGEEEKAILDSLNVERYCCRRMILTQLDLLEEVAQFDA